MFTAAHIRWSDNDHRFGPFLYAPDKYRNFCVVLDSGDDEDHPGCRLRTSAFGHTLITALPPIIRAWKRKVTVPSWNTDGTADRLGRDWYWDSHGREYGFSYSSENGAMGGGGFLQVFLGRQTFDSSTTQSWCCSTPWNNWRHVRRSLYGLNGEHFYTEPKVNWRLLDSEQNIETHKKQWEFEDSCPKRSFEFYDFDGEKITAKTRIEERQWEFGTGWFKWLSYFRKPIIRRSLNIDFSAETGKRKGSWKGGTVGHAIDMTQGELHESAFRRYCADHEMTFIETSNRKDGLWV